jgi:hypothetical protein
VLNGGVIYGDDSPSDVRGAAAPITMDSLDIKQEKCQM